MTDLTKILNDLTAGKHIEEERLLGLAYEDLRKLAQSLTSQENQANSIDASDLVHEAYLRLLRMGQNVSWENRRHFFGAAAEAMRRVLVDRARKRNSLKRGGDNKKIELDEQHIELVCRENDDENLVRLDDAMTRLEELDKGRAELVKLRYFTGLTVSEAADVLGISKSTAERSWVYARAWLKREMGK